MRSRILPEAWEDIHAAAHWYDQQRPGLGEEFTDAFETSQNEIVTNPRLFPKHQRSSGNREIRHHLLDRFPYQVIYQLLTEEVVILAVAHTSRNLRFLARRKA